MRIRMGMRKMRMGMRKMTLSWSLFETKVEAKHVFTIDERLFLNYHKLLDQDKSYGIRGRFTQDDLTKHISTRTNKYCLVISRPPYLQLLHPAFLYGE